MKRIIITKKWLCVFLAFIMMISGMCFSVREADSAFACSKKGGFSSETITSSEMPRLPHISATELSAQKYMTAVMSGRRQISGKNSVRMKQALLLTAVQSEESNYLAISARMRPCVSADSRNVNIRYIHQQDGEKG